jgi:hypothetical protein
MKKLILITFILVTIGAMVGCKYSELQYQGKLRPIYEIEEMLEEYLESENPMHDIDVRIEGNN